MSRWQRLSTAAGGRPLARAAANPRDPAQAAAAELLGALLSWRGACEAGRIALASGDAAGLERALAGRDALRPTIQELSARLRAGGQLSPALREEIGRAGAEVASADAALLEAMGAERARLRREIDALRPGAVPASGYRRPDAPNPHRLNIVR